jgi:hypothetical protein
LLRKEYQGKLWRGEGGEEKVEREGRGGDKDERRRIYIRVRIRGY